ncbi:MAG: hypothetical protein JW873_01390 [Candidatus Saganbacteria bacterium]|nr:hypothetical protein [Candidatus Saganbacteria bacterium]
MTDMLGVSFVRTGVLAWKTSAGTGPAAVNAEKSAELKDGEVAAARAAELYAMSLKKPTGEVIKELMNIAGKHYGALVEICRSGPKQLRAIALFLVSLIDSRKAISRDQDYGRLANAKLYLDAVADPDKNVSGLAKKMLSRLRFDAEQEMQAYAADQNNPVRSRQYARSLLADIAGRRKTRPVVIESICYSGYNGTAKPKYDLLYWADIRLLAAPGKGNKAMQAELYVIDPQTGKHWFQDMFPAGQVSAGQPYELAGLHFSRIYIDRRNSSVQGYYRFVDTGSEQCANKCPVVGRTGLFTIQRKNDDCDVKPEELGYFLQAMRHYRQY